MKTNEQGDQFEETMTLDEILNQYGEPLYIGSKHLVWRDSKRNRAIKATRPGYLTDGRIIVTSQPWHEPSDPALPHPTSEEMTECMKGFGFFQVNLKDWRRADGTVAKDVKPSDFIKTQEGVFPIDVSLERPR